MKRLSIKDIENIISKIKEDNKPFIEKLGSNIYRVNGMLICGKDMLDEILK